jgi:hypothetical protein
MERFIHRLNIERFKELLAVEEDPVRRRTLSKLLRDEEAREAAPDQGQGARAEQHKNQ